MNKQQKDKKNLKGGTLNFLFDVTGEKILVVARKFEETVEEIKQKLIKLISLCLAAIGFFELTL